MSAQKLKGKRNSIGHDASEGLVQHKVDLDEEREECMRRNQLRLQELGLLPILSALQSEAEAKAESKKSRPAKRQAIGNATDEVVVRRSRRNQGQEPDLPPLIQSLFQRPEEKRAYQQMPCEVKALRPRTPATECEGDAVKFDSHNLHRLRTMSDEAMLKRISKITNTLKLKSLVKLLQDFGREELAEAAQAALDERLACV